MTTVAASMKFREIAADSKCSDDSSHYQVAKLRLSADSARGAAGDWDKCIKFHELMDKGGEADDDDLDIEAIELRPDGIYVYEGILTATKIKNEFHAVGSGAHYALAAMRLGLSPAEAVSLAAEFDPGTGGQIDVWKLPEVEKLKPRRIRRKNK
jgi:hypothetical protein